jgi:DNA-binding NtrC family response regulator
VARVMVIHHDRSTRGSLEALIQGRHQVEGARDLVSGIRQMARQKPDAIIVGQDRQKGEALRLLRYMRDHVLKIPVVVAVSRGAGSVQPALLKLGARQIVEYPVDEQRLTSAIEEAMQAHKAVQAGPPPLTAEELNGNLSVLETQLNKSMKCFAGQNQVYIQSTILGGAVSRPRIALRCNLRAEYGLTKNVFFEFIREHCCGDPGRCEAYQRFQADR